MTPPTPHVLDFGFPVPGAAPRSDLYGDLYRLEWQGCRVMGIVNVTPDSFSDGGRGPEAALAHARKLLSEGAFMLDIGGESTRPGSEGVSAAEELDRILPVLRGLKDSGALISVDTLKPEVAAAALRAGAHLINDVSGLRDPQMVQVCAEWGAPACIMHMQGEPRTMQQNPVYSDVVAEVTEYLRQQAAMALAAGVPSVLLDPGIGFGKTPEHNLTLIRGLPTLLELGHPVLMAASRKRFLGALLNEPQAPAHERDAATLAVHLHSARHGAALVRAHEVRGHVQAIHIQEALGE